MNKPTTLITDVQDAFPNSYVQAHEQFIRLLPSIALPRESHSFPLTAALSTETVWIGPPEADRVLVLISATHGVEGAVGAAVQHDFLAHLRTRPRLPPHTAILLVFALNPYGFAMSRRCDGDGIDLNRNFVDFKVPLPENPGYLQLMEAIYCPDPERRRRMLDEYRREHGEEAYEIAISGGQYADPHGPFFGGTGPGHGNRTIERIIDHYRLEGRHLAVVDVHSGLGPYGHGELICDHLPEDAGFKTAMQWYGPSAAAPATGESSSVRKEGLLDYRWHTLMQNRGCFVTLEFGTYPIQNLFDVVLNDHCIWKTGDPEAIRKSAAAMREHFCPADGYWRELVLLKARQVIRQALNGLNHE
ncbi:MAG: M14 family metallopeptidase [Kiritimatiellales bacterium]|nr:M14 family metallopeptidase [Kiritimatiellales bacterium]